MFLTTLGFKCNRRLSEFVATKTSGLEQAITPKGDSRGSRTQVNLCDIDSIVFHINLYHPVISHYNRKNTPNRRYLNPELSETQIWKHEKQFLIRHFAQISKN